MKILITGVTGFAGSHLADYLLAEQNAEIHGVKRPRSRIEFIRDGIEYHESDIIDLSSMSRILREVQPDYVFHLAAQSFVPLSWQAPKATMEINAVGTLNILEAVCRECPEAVVHIAGTSEEYGHVTPEECPITEQQPLRPISPYGASKVAADMLGQVYFHSYGLKVAISRAFNHTGPRRGEEFICSKIAKALAEISHGLKPPRLKLGNTEAIRDFTDVRDTVKAYWLLASKGIYGVPYNIGSGCGRTIQEVVKELVSISGLDVEVERDPAMMRPADVPRLICDYRNFHEVTGWEPSIDFHQTMVDLYEYWLNMVE